MWMSISSKLLASIVCTSVLTSSSFAETIPNKKIDAGAFLADVRKAHELRTERRVTEQDFLEMRKIRPQSS